MGISWKKATDTLGKAWVPISQIVPIESVLQHFPMLWKTDRKNNAFPIMIFAEFFLCPEKF